MGGTPGRFLFRVLLFWDISLNTQLNTQGENKITKIPYLENVSVIVFCMEIHHF